MKRIFTILFALCLIVALTLSISAESTNKLTYTVGASASTVSANTEFTILVKVTENTGVCFIKAVVKYDSSVLTYVSGSKDTTAFTGATLDINNPKQGEVIVSLGGISAFISPNPKIYNQTGEFVVLKFKVNEDAPIGKTNISVSTGNGDVVITKNSIPDFDFDVKNASVTLSVIQSGSHTCVGGSPVKQDEIPATCTTDGSYYSVVTCTTCNAELTREKVIVPKTGHKNGEEIKENEIPAGCNFVGKYDSVVRCTICNILISKTTVIIPINDNHTPGAAVKENETGATCQTNAKYDLVVYCIVCEKEISRKTETGSKGDHVPGVPELTYKESTCINKGSITEISKCSVCSTELSRKVTELELTDHVRLPSPVKENVIEATCLKSGSYLSVVKCSVCNGTISSEVVQVDKLPHTPAKAVEENRKEPVNCGSNGSYDSVVYCSACKTEISRVTQVIDAPAHTPGHAATETTAQICTVCNVVLQPAHGHNHHWGTAFTGDSTGHWLTCTGCSEKKDFSAHVYDNNCDATCNVCGVNRVPGDHVFGPWNTVKEPTTTSEGARERNCMVCGFTDIDTIPKKAEETTVAPPVTTNPPETTQKPEETTQPPETTVEPDVTTAPETTEEPAETTAPETPADTTKSEDTTDSKKEDGCGSVVSVGIAFIAIFGSAIILKKRD